MSSLLHNQVFQSLASSPHARLELCAELGEGLGAAMWSNYHDARDYVGGRQHTLSCYLEGGTGTFRRGRPSNKGAPGKLCIMPAGRPSSWIVNGDIRLAHLYISPERFALGAVTLLDREPRELELREETFFDDAHQVACFQRLVALDWNEPGEYLLTSSLAHAMFSHALLTRTQNRKDLRLKGGLAPVQRRRLMAYIDAHLAEPLTLGHLAAQVALSEYHFARMFQKSFGVPPHQYLLARRLARARHLLAHSDQPLGEVALACGYASASHFSKRFRAAMGGTPGQYRAAMARR
ncbi:helix-turn-helix domain-containing protein [Pseudomonas sp. LRF_L74]|uniref:helix-turn-helix domain-containing protein n=1 Tax=Pseudomonas sp. LRF_L74 TaxID=3369422 RepID=UPI003F5D8906